jgi:hypothetical protein
MKEQQDRRQTLTEFIKEGDKLYGVLPWKSNYCFICTWHHSNTPRLTGKQYFILIGFVPLVYIYLLDRIHKKR